LSRLFACAEKINDVDQYGIRSNVRLLIVQSRIVKYLEKWKYGEAAH
jgi:hypothetical protein